MECQSTVPGVGMAQADLRFACFIPLHPSFFPLPTSTKPPLSIGYFSTSYRSTSVSMQPIINTTVHVEISESVGYDWVHGVLNEGSPEVAEDDDKRRLPRARDDGIS
jgi:hypothetical protein